MDDALGAAMVWFRRDLRADDHAALSHALRAARRVWCVFVLDRHILDPLLQRGLRADRRVEFIVDSLADLDAQIAALAAAQGGHAGLIVRHAVAREEIPRLARMLQVQAVYANHDDDPAALERDAAVRGALADAGIAFHTSKDHVVFERSELLTAGGRPYSVFTPYKKAWLKQLDTYRLEPHTVARHASALAAVPPELAAPPPTLQAIGFETTNLHALRLPAGSDGAHALLVDFLHRIDDYDTARDFPARKGPSYLSVHLRFGTISVRRLVREAWERMQAGSRGAAVWLSELIWREFYQQLLHHHPHVVGRAFKPAYDAIRWERGQRADTLFAAWCEGRTGYPLVDAAMAQINGTGYMHNRLRMVTASFLVKDLGIDWRRGEQYFADHLIDYELASNNGGWQWAAGTGCDAQPWFRIFNPVLQSRRFDPQGKFIRRYLPQLASLPDTLVHAPWEAGVAVDGYTPPIVMHEEARERTLQRYAVVG
ncbi:deoxyribodipyrimidine photo-lyase [Piscinibacter sp. XHJ-5]|uniref:cryptochrome/photolyase family protein n=1 Tax=Piscinibacter sp. XHJ-5 TaxID=3037797 RepID=UPI0024528464|nr:deoxyribodipyrimidine photo-lyase [Piscinibacter sp. XHJ-5]